MTSYPATWLADVLRAGGCRVIEESGWKTRGRPASTGSFKPRALLRHWDASSPGSHSTSVLINGNGSAPGPLCSIWTCDGNSDHAPSVHVIAAGRTNHGGTGDGWGVIPQDDANTYAVGHEIRQTSNQPWPADQLDQVRMAEAAILKHLSEQTSNALCSHSEYAPDRKIDTTEGSYGQNMGSERSSVQRIMDDGPEPPEDDMKHDYAQLVTGIDQDVKTSGSLIAFNSEESDTGKMHTSGDAGTRMAYNCVATGVVQVHGSGKYAIEIIRTPSGQDQSANQSRSYDESEGGWSNSPFTTAMNTGDVLRVQISALSADVPSRVSNVRLYLDMIER